MTREIIGILTMVLGIFFLLSLVSHHPSEEPTIMPGVHFHNWMGYIGIFISHLLFKLFMGWGSIILALLIILWGFALFRDLSYQGIFRISGYSFALVMVGMVLFALVGGRTGLDEAQLYRHAGYLTMVIGRFLKDFMGLVGSVLMLAVALLLLIQGWRGFTFKGLMDRFEKIWTELAAKREIRRAAREKEAELKARAQAPVQREEETPPPAPEPEELTPAPEPVPVPEPVPEPVQAEQAAEEEDIEIEDEFVEKSVDYDSSQPRAKKREYKLPSVDLLEDPPAIARSQDRDVLLQKAETLVRTLDTFGVEGRVTNIAPGPVITRYEVEPGPGIRVAKIANLSDDIARVMKAQSVRIIAPIPGKNSVGIELPNEKPEIVWLKSGINSEKFTQPESVLTIALGKTTSGEQFVADLATMPHLLVAGATGSGKSVCINSIITSLLYRARPDQVKFIMIDPKKLELSTYRRLEGYHLITSESIDEYVITKPKNAVHALRAAELEMEKRYDLLSKRTVRNIDQYNERAESEGYDPLPFIVVLIDELADLMITAAKDIEEPIARLAQMARAVGIHLVIATQRPSVDVITGVIKANFPTRIAFKVAQKNDSRTILDQNGAEKLLGRGDMLFLAPGAPAPIRLHNAFVTLEEIEAVLDHVEEQPKPEEELLPAVVEESETSGAEGPLAGGERDPLFDEAYRLVVLHQQGSVSMLQRRLRVGYARAGRLMDELEQAGIVAPGTGSKAREVLVGPEVLENPSFQDDILDD